MNIKNLLRFLFSLMLPQFSAARFLIFNLIFPLVSTFCMKKKLRFLLIFNAALFLFCMAARAEEKAVPDTVKVGIYVTSVHNIDFKQKQYDINLWLWLKYKNPDFDFQKNLEIPM